MQHMKTVNPPMNSNIQKTPVAIIGARGYSGLELTRLLLRHPAAKLEACIATDDSFRAEDYLPESEGKLVPVASPKDIPNLSQRVSTIFLATPAEVSAELAPGLVASGLDVIDLSGAFRLENGEAQKWYGLHGQAVDALSDAQYGLVPFAGSVPVAASGQGRLISNPGCYATSILMALIPLLRAGHILPESIVIDSKSGASGAGRKAAENLLYCEVDGGCLPYRVGNHQHLPEIRRFAREWGGVEIDPFFTPHLLPIRRGILSGIYARVREGVSIEDITRAFASAFEGYPLAQWSPISGSPKTALSLRHVTGSARTRIVYELKGNQLYVFSLIDNLMKGAASQALENFNRLQGLEVETALLEKEGLL